MADKTRIVGNLVSDNNLFVNPTTDNTGIGTTNPTSKLHVIGDAYVDGSTTLNGLFVDSATTLKGNLDVDGSTTVKNLEVDSALFVAGATTLNNIYSGGIVTATSFVGNFTGTATTATNVIGGIGSLSSLTVSGITTVGFLTASNISVSGIVTASSFVGNLTGTATTATNLSNAANITTGTINSARLSGTYVINVSYATTAGIATYATNAGIATNVIGGIGSLSSLSVSGISTLGTVRVSSGIITATSGIVTYYGDGSGLSNVASNLGIQSGGVTIGTGITQLNFTGVANSITVSGSTATIRINGNVLSGFSTTNFTTPTAGFTSSVVPVSGTVTANYTLTGLSPYQLVNVVGIASGGTLLTPSVLTDGNGSVTGTLSFTAGITSYASGATQNISFISNNTTINKNWIVNIIAAPSDSLVFGWDQVNDTYGWYELNTTTKLYDIAGNETYIDLSVHSRVRRCIVNDAGVVQYYLDADNSGFRSGDWLRIVERQTIGFAYTGTHTETTNSYLRLSAPSWSAGTYTLGQRVTYTGSVWECVVSSTTATPAAGSVSSDLTGGVGQVMVEIPAFCVAHAVNGNIHTFGVKLGTTPPAGYEVHPAFIKSDGSYRSYFYTGAYQSTGTSPATTISGASNRTNATRATFRTSATSRGTGWHQLSHYEYAALQFLLITEFQSVNSQKVLGNGAQEGSVYVVNTGLSNLQGNRSQNRYTSGGNSGDYVSYRGLENIYGRAWQFSDGINLNGTNVYLNKNWTTWADDTATNYTLVGDLGTGTVSGSFITNFLSLNNVLLPSSVTGGNSTSKVADGLYTSTGWRVSIVGGDTSYGALDGVFDFNFSGASSVAYTVVGGRLSFAPV